MSYRNLTTATFNELDDRISVLEIGGSTVTNLDELLNPVTFDTDKILSLNNRYQQSGAASIAFDLTDALLLKTVILAIQGDGSTITFTGDNFVMMTGSEVLNGGTLTADTTYLLYCFYDGSKVMVSISETEAATLDTTAPTVSSATVENSDTDALVVVFSEVVNITDLTGLSLNFTTGTAKTISSVAGTGTNTLTFTLSAAIENGDVFSFVYGGTNTIEDETGNALAAGSTAVTNNVGGYSVNAQAAFTNIETGSGENLTVAEKDRVSALVDAIGWADLLFFIPFVKLGSEAKNKVCWKTGKVIVPASSPTWNTSTGYTFGGANYLDLNYNPVTEADGVNVTTIIALGAFPAANCKLWGSFNGSRASWMEQRTLARGISQNTTEVSGSEAYAANNIYYLERSGNNDVDILKNNVSIGSSTSSLAVSHSSLNIYAGATNNSGTAANFVPSGTEIKLMARVNTGFDNAAFQTAWATYLAS